MHYFDWVIFISYFHITRGYTIIYPIIIPWNPMKLPLKHHWLVVSTHLKNMCQLEWWCPIYGKIQVMFQSPPTRPCPQNPLGISSRFRPPRAPFPPGRCHLPPLQSAPGPRRPFAGALEVLVELRPEAGKAGKSPEILHWPMENGDWPMENRDLPMENRDLPMESRWT